MGYIELEATSGLLDVEGWRRALPLRDWPRGGNYNNRSERNGLKRAGNMRRKGGLGQIPGDSDFCLKKKQDLEQPKYPQ